MSNKQLANAQQVPHLLILAEMCLTGCNSLLSTSSAATADVVCFMDRPAISSYFTLTITNPGSSVITAATVQINFYDASGNLIDTQTSDVGDTISPGQHAVFHDAEE